MSRLFPGDTDADQAWLELKTLLETRVDEGLSRKLSTKTVGEILDDELAKDRA